jgi:hypothetical protein
MADGKVDGWLCMTHHAVSKIFDWNAGILKDVFSYRRLMTFLKTLVNTHVRGTDEVSLGAPRTLFIGWHAPLRALVTRQRSESRTTSEQQKSPRTRTRERTNRDQANQSWIWTRDGPWDPIAADAPL